MRRSCENCGEPATRKTADGVWLCKGDYEALCEYEALCDAAWIEDYVDCAHVPDPPKAE